MRCAAGKGSRSTGTSSKSGVDKSEAILVLGGSGMVGSAIQRALDMAGFTEIRVPSRAQLDLLDAGSVAAYFEATKPAFVFMAAAKVGGILANDSLPADFLYQNLLIEAHVIHQAHRHNVNKLLYLGSTCAYPRLAPQPLKEDYLLTGPLESTNEWYAIAKIAGIKLCQAYRRQHGCRFISAMPTNLYGPNDNFDPETAHVLPAFIRRFHEAMVQGADTVTIWGSGEAMREFLHVDDCADACLFLMQHYDEDGPINIGVGRDISINELAVTVARIAAFEGTIEHDRSKPDGTPRKLVDVQKLSGMGWRARIDLDTGIRSTYDWYRSSIA